MSISLENFREWISPDIIQRGRDYFNKNLIQNLDEVEDGRWQAEVEGSYLYQVEIQILPDGSLEYFCNCPYDWGPVCKHVAAVLFAIEDTFSEYFEKPKKVRKPRKKRKTKSEKLDDILGNAGHEELVEIVKDLALEDRQFYNQLEMRFGKLGDKKSYVRMVKDALRQGKDQHGFIDYYGADRAAGAVRAILLQAENYLEQKQYQKALPVFQAILETVTPVMGQADDSNGSLGDCISYSVMGMKEVAGNLEGKSRQVLFDYFLEKTQDKTLHAWDWGWDVAQVAADMIQTAEEREKVFTVLDALVTHSLSDYVKEDFSTQYDFSQVQTIKLSVIERQNTMDEIEEFLQKNIEVYGFRERLVDLYLQQKRLEEAKKVCEAYLSRSVEGHYRGRARFLSALLEIAKIEEDNQRMLQLAKELFYETRDFKYYELLKNTAFEQSWEDIFNEILEIVHPDVLHDIYVREKMWEALLSAAYTMGDYSIEKYRFHLEKYYPKETCDIYARFIYQKLEKASKRGVYRDACRYLRRINKLGQADQMESIIVDLRERYKNRPALMDELNKV